MPESRVQQVQHRVLRAADVQIDAVFAHPIRLGVLADELLVVPVVAVAQVVPARPRPPGHGVGLATDDRFAMQRVHPRFTRGRLHPVCRLGEQWLGLVAFHGLIVRQRRQQHGQRLLTHRVVMPALIEHDRERLAPVALAREQPVAELVVHLAGADFLLGHPFDDLGLRVRDVQPVEHVRVDRRPVARVRLAVEPFWRLHRADDRKIELGRKVPVALILPRHGHDCPGAIAHHHIIRRPDGYLLARNGVGDADTDSDTGLLFVLLSLHIRAIPRPLDIVLQTLDVHALGLGLQSHLNERVLRSHDHVGRAIDGVGTRRKNAELLTQIQPAGEDDREIDLRAN